MVQVIVMVEVMPMEIMVVMVIVCQLMVVEVMIHMMINMMMVNVMIVVIMYINRNMDFFYVMMGDVMFRDMERDMDDVVFMDWTMMFTKEDWFGCGDGDQGSKCNLS